LKAKKQSYSKEQLDQPLYDNLSQYDGVLDESAHFEIVVKSNTQVKSVDNSGEFNPSNTNIYHQISTLQHHRESLVAYREAVNSGNPEAYRTWLQTKQDQLAGDMLSTL
jgi:accessory colonization factor AcfC